MSILLGITFSLFLTIKKQRCHQFMPLAPTLNITNVKLFFLKSSLEFIIIQLQIINLCRKNIELDIKDCDTHLLISVLSIGHTNNGDELFGNTITVTVCDPKIHSYSNNKQLPPLSCDCLSIYCTLS